MAESFTRVAEADVEQRERKGGGPASRDIAGTLGAEHITLRVWRFGPGHQMAYHRHAEQEEMYKLLSGGPQQILVEGEMVTVQDGEWLRFPKDVARRIENTTDREAVWLTLGAPVGAGIRDGIRIDPETGAEIPRT